jgi:hypothetical protein
MIPMADYTEPDYVDRRLRYFDGQFLREQDFIDEQRYHLDRERRLARVAHTPGIVEGLAVTAVPNAPKVTVAPGTAIDGLGRLLVRVDAGEPLDLTDLVNHDSDVTVVVALTYSREEADAPQGGASPRWREHPRVVRWLAGAADAPPESTTVRLARVTLPHPDGTAGVDPGWAPPMSGLGVRGALDVRGALGVAGVASFPGGIAGGAGTGGEEPPPLSVRSRLQVTGEPTFDSTTRVDLVNGSDDFGRTNLVLTGRFQDGNDGWNFGSAARNSIVFARNAAASRQAVGAIGDEQVSLQMEGNSRSLGILTRTRGSDPAMTIAQEGTVHLGSADRRANLQVQGEVDVSLDLTVLGGLASGEVGQWSTLVFSGSQWVRITIGPRSPHNIIVVRRRAGVILEGQVFVPSGTEGEWVGRYTFHDPANRAVGVMTPLLPGTPMRANAQLASLPAGANPVVLYLEVHHATTLEG